MRIARKVKAVGWCEVCEKCGKRIKRGEWCWFVADQHRGFFRCSNCAGDFHEVKDFWEEQVRLWHSVLR